MPCKKKRPRAGARKHSCSLRVAPSKMAAVGQGFNEKERRRVIKTLLAAGVHSVREISERSGLSKSTVSRVRHRLLNGGTIERKIGSGSLQHLSGVALQTMRDLVEGSVATGGSVSTAKLRSEIEDRTAGGKGVSRMTVCRALHREGFSVKRRRVGPALIARHRDARQVWSLLHRDDQFDATVFIDEANFQIHRNTQVVWCRANQPAPRLGMPHTSPSITVLAGLSSVGVTPLVIRHSESWTAERFVESLSNDIEPVTNAFFDGAHRYMLDNAPCHTANFTRNWADANGVSLLFQPSFSPMFNRKKTSGHC